jgi:hypothetical protein
VRIDYGQQEFPEGGRGDTMRKKKRGRESETSIFVPAVSFPTDELF